MTIGYRIRQIRKSKNMTLEYVSKKTGKDISLLSRYETGLIKEIPVTFLPSLAEALGVEIADLFEVA